MLENEITIIAERWKWSRTEIMTLPILERRRYVEKIIEMYEKENENNKSM